MVFDRLLTAAVLAVYALFGVVLCDRLGVIDMPPACEGRWLTPQCWSP